MRKPSKSQEREAYWQEHVSKQAASGLTVPTYCSREEIGMHSLYMWRKRFREQVEQASPGSAQKNPVPFALVDRLNATPSTIQIVMATGDRIEIGAGKESLALLLSVIKALRQERGQ